MQSNAETHHCAVVKLRCSYASFSGEFAERVVRYSEPAL